MARSLRQLLVDREAELGVNVADAAKLAGLDVRQYQKYRNEGVIPQGPQRKRLSDGLGIQPRELNDAIEVLEHDQAYYEDVQDKWIEAPGEWLEAPPTRQDIVDLGMKLSDVEHQLREIRDHLQLEAARRGEKLP